MKKLILGLLIAVSVVLNNPKLLTEYTPLGNPVYGYLAADHLGIMQLWDSNFRGGGTGWFIEHKGILMLVTNAHVCDILEPSPINDGGSYLVFKKDGKLESAVPVISVRAFDLCIAAVRQDLNVNTLTLGSSKDLRAGDFMVTLGWGGLNHPELAMGAYLSRTPYGICIKPVLFGCEERAIFLDSLSSTVQSEGGDSGSPVFGINGTVIGILHAGNGKEAKIIPVEYLLKLLEKLPL